MNRKGFVFVETIIVIAIMLSSLMLIYSLYASSVSNENIRLRYDDTAKLYETFYLKKYLESFDLDALKARINDGEPYQMIYRGTSEVFGSSYSNEKIFLENMWMDLHIESIILFGSNISEIVECNRDDTAMICSNTSLLNYLKTLDDEAGYRLVIEYAMDESGNTCTSPIGCYYYYSSVKVDEYLNFAKILRECCQSGKSAAQCYIENVSKNSSELMIDNTADHNVRYIGKAPKNYFQFNNETWRMIGVMNNIDNGTGKIESRIKLIKDESIGEYAWNTENKNDWSNASLQKELNGQYLNNMDNSAKSLIDSAVWNIGGTEYIVNVNEVYKNERSTKVLTGNQSKWTGKIGLMYPSDYGYATKGGSKTNQQNCFETDLYYWDRTDYSDCHANDWVNINNTFQWTLTPCINDYFNAENFKGVMRLGSGGGAYQNDANSAGREVKPVVFLKASVKVTGGEGTKDKPFTITN